MRDCSHKVQFCTIRQEAMAQNCLQLAALAVLIFLLTISDLFSFFFCGFYFIPADIWREKPFLSRPFPRVCLLTAEDSGGVPWVPKQTQSRLSKGVRSGGFRSGFCFQAFPKWFQWNGFAQMTRWEKATGVGHLICAMRSVHFTFQLCLVP